MKTPTAGSVHRRLSVTKGKARQHDCIDCGRQALDWSYQGGDPEEVVETVVFRAPKSDGSWYEHEMVQSYSLNPDFYVPRCRSCHRRYDLGWRGGVCPRGHDTNETGLYSFENNGRSHFGKRYRRQTCAECRREASRAKRRNAVTA